MPDLRLRALIADDDPHMREVIASILGMLGVNVIAQADDGLRAITLHEALRPDIVLLDVIMPGLSGLEVLHRIRQIDAQSRIVILTEDDGFEVARQSIALGALCYIRKTNSADAILDLLATSLGLVGAKDAPGRPG